jgi:hypothetical protein
MPWRRIGEWKYSSTILDLGVRWSASRSGRLTASGNSPRYPIDRGWMAPRAGLGTVEEIKTFFHLPRFELRPLSPKPVAIPTGLSRLQYDVSSHIIENLRWKWGAERLGVGKTKNQGNEEHDRRTRFNTCTLQLTSVRRLNQLKSMNMIWAVYATHTGEMRNTCKIMVGNPQGKSPLQRHRCRLEGKVKWILEKHDKVVGCVQLAQGTVQWWDFVNKLMKCRIWGYHNGGYEEYNLGI